MHRDSSIVQFGHANSVLPNVDSCRTGLYKKGFQFQHSSWRNAETRRIDHPARYRKYVVVQSFGSWRARSVTEFVYVPEISRVCNGNS
jgi:hypothetical protein